MMKAVVYRPRCPEGHKSWRPKSLEDRRGAVFPDEYEELFVLIVEDLEHALEQFDGKLGDIVFLGEGDDLMAYVLAPIGYELVKFGAEWKSPP